jgi:hypothetical protein
MNSQAVEWIRAKQVLAQFGIGRATLYRLVKEGRIESQSLKRADASKGIRVFSVQSIRSLLAASSL